MAEAPSNTHNKRSLFRTSHVCHRRHAAGRNQLVEEYKHAHTHIHTHTHTHTGQISVRGILVEHSHDIFLVYSEKVPYEIPANIPK